MGATLSDRVLLQARSAASSWPSAYATAVKRTQLDQERNHHRDYASLPTIHDFWEHLTGACGRYHEKTNDANIKLLIRAGTQTSLACIGLSGKGNGYKATVNYTPAAPFNLFLCNNCVLPLNKTSRRWIRLPSKPLCCKRTHTRDSEHVPASLPLALWFAFGSHCFTAYFDCPSCFCCKGLSLDHTNART